MDEIRRLENQIKELQRQLQAQNAEAARMRQRLADENLQRLQAYQKEMENNLDRHDKQVQQEYERLLHEYQRSIDRELSEQQLQMDMQYQKLMVSMKQKEQEWMEKTRQMEQLIVELKKQNQQKEEASASEAEKYLTEAARTYYDVEKKPHEKFFPKRIKNFQRAIAEARNLFKQGLNEAAIAISISTRSGLNRLGYDIDDKSKEWIQEYELFKTKVLYFRSQLNDELVNWQKEALGKTLIFKHMSDNDKKNSIISINFWSDGDFNKIRNRVNEFGQMIIEVEKQTPDVYLKNENGMTYEDMKKYIEELDKMTEDFEKVKVYHLENYKASCERADWGETIIDFFTEELNLVWDEEKSHYRYYEDLNDVTYKEYMEMQYGADYEKVDTRDWLELLFNNSMDSDIMIYLVPYKHKNNVENRIVVYINFNGSENLDYSRQIYRHICECLQLEEDDGTLTFATDVDQLATSMDATLRAAGNSIKKKIKQ